MTVNSCTWTMNIILHGKSLGEWLPTSKSKSWAIGISYYSFETVDDRRWNFNWCKIPKGTCKRQTLSTTEWKYLHAFFKICTSCFWRFQSAHLMHKISLQYWHFCTTSNGNDLGMDTSWIHFNVNLHFSSCSEVKLMSLITTHDLFPNFM